MTKRPISEKALANTYDNGWATVEQYRTALDLRDEQPDLAQTEIARRVERSPTTVRAWLVEAQRPDPVQALETAEARGWLGADVESELFRAINALTAWIFAGGGISQQSFEPRFSADDTLELATLSHLFGIADLPYWLREEGGERADQAFEIGLGNGATIFGRLLSTIGAPVGQKAAQMGVSLPKYLDDAPIHLQRDFAQVYLLTRASQMGDTGRYRIGEIRTPEYLHELQAFLSRATDGDVSIGSQSRLIIPEAAVESLCRETPHRTALAAQIAHGRLIPPTERAVMMAYRRGELPSGQRYLDAYHAATADDTVDREAVAEEYGLSRMTVYNWQQGATPKLLTAVETIDDYGWITPSTPEPAYTLTALAAWVSALGTLRETVYPVFRLRTTAQREWFQVLADRLGLSFNARLEDNERTTELHITTDASRLGRVLHAIGVPTADQNVTHLPPPYIWHDVGAARAYVSTWVLHHGSIEGESLHIGNANGGSKWMPHTLTALAQERLDWTIKAHTDQGVEVAYEEARPTLEKALTSSIVTEFEHDQFEE